LVEWSLPGFVFVGVGVTGVVLGDGSLPTTMTSGTVTTGATVTASVG
jgi:hypothetical protein